MSTSFESRLKTAPEEGIKAPCQAVSLDNITLSGEQTIGTIDVVAGDRVLVAGQSSSADNGIYDVKVGAWSRSTDWNDSQDVVNGVTVVVPNGIYQCGFTGNFSIGVTNVSFTNIINTATQSVETLVATEGQTLFTLVEATYLVGDDNLEVFINGVHQEVGRAYTETSSSSITFSQGLNAGDRVICKVGQTATPTEKSIAPNKTVYEFTSDIGVKSHANIVTGHSGKLFGTSAV